MDPSTRSDDCLIRSWGGRRGAGGQVTSARLSILRSRARLSGDKRLSDARLFFFRGDLPLTLLRSPTVCSVDFSYFLLPPLLSLSFWASQSWAGHLWIRLL